MYEKIRKILNCAEVKMWSEVSVTRLGHLLHLGQLFKARGSNYLAQIAHIFRQFSIGNNFWATFLDIWQLFTGHAGCDKDDFILL